MKCKNCGKELEGNGKPSGFCKYSCYEEWTKWHKEPNCVCAICGKAFYLKPSRLKTLKYGATCSYECAGKFRSQWFVGENNHQYGLKGDKNASFKGKETLHPNHSIVDIYVYEPNHPYANKDGRVVKHRLLVEQNHDKFDPKFFETINGIIVLKKEYQVHHKDENHNNNSIENLEVLTRSEHTALHNLEKEIIRDPLTGRITGIVKHSELLETPEVDNQQPSQNSNILKGSETNTEVLTKDESNTSTMPCNTGEDIVRTDDITNETSEITE